MFESTRGLVYSFAENCAEPALSITRFVEIPLAEVRATVERILRTGGYADDEVEIIRDVLLYAELRGNGQGLIKLLGPGMPKDVRAETPTVDTEGETFARINGNYSPAMVVLHQASLLAAQKAQSHGIAIVGTYRTNQSTGAAGYYARLLAERGCVGMVYCGTPALVAPYGASEALFGTNPIAQGSPSSGHTVVSDITTSAIAYFDCLKAKERGEKLAPHTAFDKSGSITCDPEKALPQEGGAFTSMDRGARGSALGFNTTVLTTALVGAELNRPHQKNDNWGNVVIAIRSDLFVPEAEFRAKTAELEELVRSRRPAPGVQEVLVPGERGDRQEAQTLGAGLLRIPQAVWEQLAAR